MQKLILFGMILCTLALAACTSPRPLTTVEPDAVRAQVKPGDEVVLTTKDGTTCEGTVQRLDERVLSVTRTDGAHAGESVEIPYESLASVAIRRPDSGRTVFAVLGGSAVGIFVLLSVAILLAFG